MFKNHNALNKNLDVGPLDLDHISNMRMEFFERLDYEWWKQVEEGDVVVDVGACVGFFTTYALDHGASKVYAIEPNKELLKLVIKNGFDYIVDNNECPIVPIHAAIGSNTNHVQHVYDGGSEFPLISFKDFVIKYDIQKIDYLKVDCEGGEYSFLNAENLVWISKNVKHIALEVHLRASESSKEDFIRFRDDFLHYFFERGQVNFMNSKYKKTIWDNDAIFNEDYESVPAEFMIYITNN